MAGMPPELTDMILSHMLDVLGNDPARQWMTLRHLSSDLMHRVERHFFYFWLPKLVISVYTNAWVSADFRLVKPNRQLRSNRPFSDIAYFTYHPDLRANMGRPSKATTRALRKHSGGRPECILRLGDGYLNRGYQGGHIINDTEIPGLQVSDDGYDINFDWRGTFTALLREEMMMRRLVEPLVPESSHHDLSQAADLYLAHS
jgi:hypothetical protein